MCNYCPKISQVQMLYRSINTKYHIKTTFARCWRAFVKDYEINYAKVGTCTYSVTYMYIYI